MNKIIDLPMFANPAAQAEWDYWREGCSANPYPENSRAWETYELTYDLLCMEEERKTNQEMTNGH